MTQNWKTQLKTYQLTQDYHRLSSWSYQQFIHQESWRIQLCSKRWTTTLISVKWSKKRTTKASIGIAWQMPHHQMWQAIAKETSEIWIKGSTELNLTEFKMKIFPLYEASILYKPQFEFINLNGGKIETFSYINLKWKSLNLLL